MADEKEWLGKIADAAGESKARLKAEKAKLKAANTRADSIILSPKDILTGEWDASRTLETTIGGGIGRRPITNADLAAFSRNIKTVRKRHDLKGIKAQQVIDWSTPNDRRRTSRSYLSGNKTIQPIRHASPVLAVGDIVRFITNAGGTTPGVTRHNVTVNFPLLSEMASAAERDDKAIGTRLFAKKLAQKLAKAPLKFYCDCARHKYWYGYIATIGGFAVKPPHGLLQHGYPKITNPNLDGIACKHTIRVMQEIIGSPHVQSYLARHLERMLLAHNKSVQTRQGQKDAENLIKSQARRANDAAMTTTEKRAAESAKKADRAKSRLAKAAAAAPPPSKKSTTQRRIDTAATAADKIAALRAAMAVFGIEPTQDQINTMLKGK